jgi:hypothetical protein
MSLELAFVGSLPEYNGERPHRAMMSCLILVLHPPEIGRLFSDADLDL